MTSPSPHHQPHANRAFRGLISSGLCRAVSAFRRSPNPVGPVTFATLMPTVSSRAAARRSLIRGYRMMAERYAQKGQHVLAGCCHECADVLESSTSPDASDAPGM